MMKKNKNTKRLSVVENLESRTLMSGGSVDWDHAANLVIKGTTGSDSIYVQTTDLEYSNGDAFERVWHIEVNDNITTIVTPYIYNTTISGLGGNDSIEIVGLKSGSKMAITTGAGNDSLKVEQQEGGVINFNAGGGTNAADWRAPDFFDKWGETNFAVTSTDVEYLGMPRLQFSGLQSLSFTGSFRDDTIAVKSIASGMNVNVNGQQGNDTLIVGNGNIAANIRGNLTVDGGFEYSKIIDTDNIAFDDTQSFGGIETFEYNTFSKNGLLQAITWKGAEQVTFNASNYDDAINIDEANVKLLTLNGNGGNDLFNVGGSGLGNLQFVQTSALNIDGGTGKNLVTANDKFASGPHGYIIGATRFKAGTAPYWNTANIQQFTLLASSGNNYVNAYGAGENVYFVGQGGNDTVLGGPHDDTLYGGAGNDNLYGNAGDDFIDGGTGSDYMSGGIGWDKISYAARVKAVTVNLNKLTGNGEAGENDSIFSDFEIIEGGAGNDTITLSVNQSGWAYGDGGNDTLIGGNKADWLDGGSGNDLLKGNGGNDILIGQAGTDKLSGGAGDDIIVAGDSEKDILDGGSGNNTYYKDAIDVFQTIN